MGSGWPSKDHDVNIQCPIPCPSYLLSLRLKSVETGLQGKCHLCFNCSDDCKRDLRSLAGFKMA